MDNAFGVALTANLVATFSETIQKGTGNITIRRTDGTVFETINVTSSTVTLSGGRVTINPVNNFVAGAGYHVLIDPTALRNTTSLYYAGISDPTVWNFTALPDLATVDGRLTWMMQQNITNRYPSTGSVSLASYALAAFYLGTDLVTANDYINQFHDLYPVPDSNTMDFDSYFWLHLIWRIYHDPAMNARLTPLARADILDMMWRFIRTRSTTSNAQGDAWIYNGSENHDAMRKGSYLLCAEALKDAPGYGPGKVLADGQTLAQHATAWSGYFQRYFIGRAKEGLNAEIASPTYAKYSVGVYYNIMDFAESPVLRTLAQRFVTLYWADTASDWTLSGVRGGGQARCYKDDSIRLGNQYSFQSLLYGYGWHAASSTVRIFAMIPATSSYRVPAIITACASAPARPNYLYTSRRFGRDGYNSLIAFDSGNSNLRRDTWVTPDYTMGTMTFDMNRDYLQIVDQNRAMGVMFASGSNNRVMVFGKGSTVDNKSYADLSGVTRANCMVVQRDPNANSTGSGTLVFVPQSLWDARVENSGWLFLQSGNAYCAVRPASGTYTAATAARGVDLSMSNIWAPVIIQMGQKANYVDFAAFQASVIANALTYSTATVPNTLNYTSEAGDTFTFYANSKTTPRVNGTTVNLNPTKTYDSPYLSMVHGEDIATISYPGYTNLVLDFDAEPTLASLAPADNTNAVVSANLVATFDEPVQAGTGFIRLKRVSDNSTVESFDVSSSPRLIFSRSQLTIDPTSNLSIGTAYYVTIDATAIVDLSGKPFAGISTSGGWNFTAVALTTLNSVSKVQTGALGGGTATLSFDAGASADLLVVALSHEKGSGAYAVSYGGMSLSAAVLGGSADIWYLDLTTNSYAGGATNLVVNYAGITTVNGVGIAAVSATSGGLPLGLHATATGANGSANVSLTTSNNNAFTVASFNANGSGTVSVNAPLTPIYQSADIGSARGAAGFATGVPAGTHSYSWTTGEPRQVVAAAFVVRNFSSWISNPAFGLAPADQELFDDPDGDGIDNGVESFFGTNPGTFTQGLAAGIRSGNTFTFTHPQGTPAADLTANYRWSTDFATFHLGGATSGGTTVNFTTQANTPSPGFTRVTATATGTLPGRLFVDVKVTGP
jgi:hypothetical protein